MQQALGLIETFGLVAAIEAADAMVKAAKVTLLGRQKVKGGLHAVMVSGDVGAVKAATDAGGAAARRVGRVVSVHVIPRPHEDIGMMILKGPLTPAQTPAGAKRRPPAKRKAGAGLRKSKKTKG